MIYLAIAGFAAFILGPLLARLEIVPALTGLAICGLGALEGLAVTVGAGIVLWRTGQAPEAWVLIAGIVPAVFLVGAVATALRYPMVNDISTDLEDPPEFVHTVQLPENAKRDMSFRQASAEIIRTHYADVAPLHLRGTPADAFDKALAAVKQLPGASAAHVDKERLVFEGTAITSLFRFRDDFVVRVRPEADGARIDMRSKSRDGKSDLGVNAARIKQFFRLLQESQR